MVTDVVATGILRVYIKGGEREREKRALWKNEGKKEKKEGEKKVVVVFPPPPGLNESI